MCESFCDMSLIILCEYRKLSADMEATRAALDCEHKLQLIQMEAINALWKKVLTVID